MNLTANGKTYILVEFQDVNVGDVIYDEREWTVTQLVEGFNYPVVSIITEYPNGRVREFECNTWDYMVFRKVS